MIKTSEIAQEKPTNANNKESWNFIKGNTYPSYVRAIIHAFIWIIFFALLMSFHLFSRPFDTDRPLVSDPITYKFGLLYLFLIGMYYFNAKYAIPRLLFQRKVLLYSGTLVFMLVLVQSSNFVLTNVLNLEPRRIYEERRSEMPPSFPPSSINTNRPLRKPIQRIFDPFALLSSFIILGISTSLTVTSKWFKDAEDQKILEKEHVSSELALLKNQINPHFFFNILNNIYVLAETSPSAQTAIYTLSKMMRYMLYETENSQVLLNKEIEFIKHYLALMRLRLINEISVEFKYPKDIGQLTIAPLIFIPFIENAFKHGVSYNEKSFVKSKLDLEGKVLYFTVSNRIIKETKPLEINGSGIGMANVQRRLHLLYPGRHDLQIDTQNNEFNVHLKIDLS